MCEIEPFPDYPAQIPRFVPLGRSGSGSGGEENSTTDDINLNTSSELGNDSSLQVYSINQME